jgi:hypothetical protein|nr:MAG TPA: hypothetical protein [Caudoviricetes sp.]
MGFAKNLGKGFIRSAVNQVGRDAGKVVSNQVYGDAHSTPHRIVDNKTIHNNEDNETAEYIESHSTFGIFIRILLAFLCNILGGVVLLIYGIKKKSKASFATVYKYESVPTYENDRRYKSGVRYAGDITVKKKYQMQADSDTEQQNRRVADIYIWSGVAIIAFSLVAILIAG